MKYFFNNVFQFLNYLKKTVFLHKVSKQYVGGAKADSIPFYQKALIAGMSGAVGGFVGTPGDMINVRMQNDIKIPEAQRRK
jgi:dicarboxylate transporter 10